jgi:hypothetical protein
MGMTVPPASDVAVLIRTCRYPVGYSIILLDTVPAISPRTFFFISLKYCRESVSLRSGKMLAFLQR